MFEKYNEKKLKDSAGLIDEILELDTDIEIELEDDIFINFYSENPWKLEVREGVDGDFVYEYSIPDDTKELLYKYGELYIENIR